MKRTAPFERPFSLPRIPPRDESSAGTAEVGQNGSRNPRSGPCHKTQSQEASP